MLSLEIKECLRRMKRRRGLHALVLSILGVAIAACTLFFSLLDHALWSALPVRQADRLATLSLDYGNVSFGFGVPELQEVLQAPSVESAGLATWLTCPVAEAGNLSGVAVSGKFLDTVGPRFRQGRGFLDNEEVAVVLSHGLAARLNGAAEIQFDGVRLPVVGVLEPAYHGLPGIDDGADYWLALGALRLVKPTLWAELQTRKSQSTFTMIRLRPGVTAVAAKKAHAEQARVWAACKGQGLKGADIHLEVRPLVDLRRELISGGAAPVRIIVVLVALLLALALLNVAGILLAQSFQEADTAALRAALGESLRYVVRRTVALALLLAIPAGFLGLVLGLLGSRVCTFWLPQEFLLRSDPPALNGHILLFTAGISVAATVAVTFLPSLAHWLKHAAGRAPKRWFGLFTLKAILAGQIALATTVLALLTFSANGLRQTLRTDVGFQTEHLLLLQTKPPDDACTPSGIRVFSRILLEKLQGLPEIASATVGSSAPLGRETSTLELAGRKIPVTTVWEGYFRTLGIPLLMGRDFSPEDGAGLPENNYRPNRVIVSRALADRLFPGQNPLGKILNNNGRGPEIIGTVGNARMRSLEGTDDEQIYLSTRQAFMLPPELIVRVRTMSGSLQSRLETLVREVRPGTEIRNFTTMEQRLRDKVGPKRLAVAFLGALTGLSLLIVLGGVYGLQAFLVAQRRRELGVRMALGASPWQLAGMVMRSGLGASLLGLAAGWLGTLICQELLPELTSEASRGSLEQFMVAAFGMLLMVCIASLRPAREAARIQPLELMRAGG